MACPANRDAISNANQARFGAEDTLSRLVDVLQSEKACVYCQIVETRGSTPQEAGASLLVFPDGSQAGTIGGGCVEAEIKQQALRLLHPQAQAEVATFHLDNLQGWDDGLICGGRLSILLQPLLPEQPAFANARSYFQKLILMAQQGESYTQAIAIQEGPQGCPGERYLFDASGKTLAGLAKDSREESIHARYSQWQTYPKQTVQDGWAFLTTPARPTLWIIGAGHVGQAVAELAAHVGFRICVLDDRAQYASAERFPLAEQLRVGPIGTTLAQLAPTWNQHTYALIVTRGHQHDHEALFHLATSPCGYVGMIGSRRKVRLIFEDLAAHGIPHAALQRVRAPVGLEIGSQTVPEIAVSIVAELIAVRHKCPLPDRRLP